jgi:hypothetical protein
MKTYTQQQINKKYAGKYVEVGKAYNYGEQRWDYEVRRVYAEIHENTTRGEDLGTELEYRR